MNGGILLKKNLIYNINKMNKKRKPKGGLTPYQYKYIGPYNPLNDPETGEILEWYDKPYNINKMNKKRKQIPFEKQEEYKERLFDLNESSLRLYKFMKYMELSSLEDFKNDYEAFYDGLKVVDYFEKIFSKEFDKDLNYYEKKMNFYEKNHF